MVQILIYGLAVFHIERDEADNPTKITVYLRQAGQHEVSLAQGSKSFRWQPIDKDRGGSPLQLGNRTITFNLGGDLAEKRSATPPAGDYPAGVGEASDVHWMINYGSIDRPTPFLFAREPTRAVFEAGTLETCGLVHEPGPSFAKVCRIEVGDGRYERSASEYMVVRQVITIDTDTVDTDTVTDPVTITVRDEGDETGQEVGVGFFETCAGVEWRGTTYLKVIDIAVRNLPRATGARSMVTNHLEGLKSLFPAAESSWAMSSPDCRTMFGRWECPEQSTTRRTHFCRINLQPSCWSHFSQYWEEFEMSWILSGSNRPICPLLEWP